MNSRSALPFGILLVTFLSSCHKKPLETDDTGIISPENLIQTWVVDDEDQSHYTETTQSVTFKDKKYLSYTINSDSTYLFTYYDKGNNKITERGTCSFNATKKTITFYPGVLPPQAGTWVDPTNYWHDSYQFGVKTLTEEHFTLIGTHKKITYTYDSEGVAHPVTSDENETLYLEDND